jgi:ketopantoate reductase
VEKVLVNATLDPLTAFFEKKPKKALEKPRSFPIL